MFYSWHASQCRRCCHIPLPTMTWDTIQLKLKWHWIDAIIYQHLCILLISICLWQLICCPVCSYCLLRYCHVPRSLAQLFQSYETRNLLITTPHTDLFSTSLSPLCTLHCWTYINRNSRCARTHLHSLCALAISVAVFSGVNWGWVSFTP